MTLAIAHTEGQKEILDCIREIRPPFDPDETTRELAGLIKSYGLNSVTGDRYAGEWPRERFRAHGVDYRLSEKTKSDIYKELLPLVNAKRVDLLDNPRLAAQAQSLERRVGRGGRDSIDHPLQGHDDVINAAAGALVSAGSGLQYRVRLPVAA